MVHTPRAAQVTFALAGSLVVVLAVVGVILQPALALGAIGAVALVAIAMANSTVAVSLWILVVVFVPFWTTFSGGGVTVSTAFLSIPIVLGILLRRVGETTRGVQVSYRIAGVDLLVVAGVVVAIVSQQVFEQAAFLVTNVAVTLFGGYVIGRLAKPDIRRVFAGVMIFVAIWGIVEFVLDLHVFVNWLPGTGGLGPIIQERGGLARSEVSLGHAIAYGACLAAAIPLVRDFKRSTLWQTLLLVGILVSVSRGPMIAAIFAVALVLYVTRDSKARLRSAALLIIGLVGLYFVFSLLYEGAGQSDVTLSQQARDGQITQTLSYINLFGPAEGTQMTSEGLYAVNGVDKVDSAPLRLALDFGWLGSVLLLSPLLLVAWRVLIRRAGPATVALATQIPVIFVTSFITQWQTLFFFLAGLAVTEYLNARKEEQELNLGAVARTKRPTKKHVNHTPAVAR